MPAALTGLTILERGWLSSNNVLLHGEGRQDGAGAVLVDASHCLHGEQTVALVRHALRGEPLARLINTHLHSDHCGGNAAVQRAFEVPLSIPPGEWDAVLAWDEEALTYRPSGQRCERFVPQGRLMPGDRFEQAGRQWHVLEAPGHDAHSVILFDSTQGVLISADALWEDGFGVVFPEIDGESAFGDVGAVLDLIEALPVQWVVPGHGAPFSDVSGALQRARRRLDAFQADPGRHARHAAKVLVKYHLMEERAQSLSEVLRWALATRMFQSLWRSEGQRHAATPAEWCERLVADLAQGGALALRGAVVHDA
jgi:glyoxylase-like metal-dependent hydrolase (beta-lactamase superfamily II)